MPHPLVHIGYHKTGSTWLQRNLFQLSGAGYIVNWTFGELLDQFVLIHDLDFNASAARAFFDERIAAANDPDGIPAISYERLSGNPHSGGYDSASLADRVCETWEDARVLIVIREQIGAICSTYKQYLLVGGIQSPRRYLNPPHLGRARVPLFSWDHFAYDRLIALYQGRLGRERVLVLPFEMFRSDALAFVNAINRFAGVAERSEIPTSRANVALGGLTLAFKRQMNKLFVRDSLNPNALIDSQKAGMALQKACATLDRLHPSFLRASFDRRLRRIVTAQAGDRYAASNRRTAELSGLDLSALGYTV